MKLALRETIIAGNLIFNKITTNRRKNDKIKTRAKKSNPTPMSVEKMNQHYAEKKFNILLHHNFKAGDLYVTLTYRNNPGKDFANKKITSFIKKLKRRYKKAAAELKWVHVTEYENCNNLHHHFVLSYIDPAIIYDCWKEGFIKIALLDESGDWRKLGNYLIKETSRTFRNPDAFSKQRYSKSRNVVMPEVRVEEVSTEQLFVAKATKGYYIDQDSIIKGINPDTEKPYMEFIQVALDTPCKKYCRGKRKKYKREHIKSIITERQLSLVEFAR